MAQLLVRNLPDEDVATLKEEARARNRSLEAEAREALHRQAEMIRRREKFWKEANAIRQSLEGSEQTDSAILRKFGRRDEIHG